MFGQIVRPHGSGPSTRWHDLFGFDDQIVMSGDFNGDGLDDIITFTRGSTGDVYVALSNGKGFNGTGQKWHDYFCIGDEIPKIGDFNGDGKDDIITFVRSTKSGIGEGDVVVALSTGSSFTGASNWHGFFCIGQEVPEIGDFNGDGKDDIITFVRSTKSGIGEGDVVVALSNGSDFIGETNWHGFFCIGQEVPKIGDFNGDGKDDIASFIRSTKSGIGEGDVIVALSNGNAFTEETNWHEFFCIREEIPEIGDFNGDGKDDIISFIRSTKSGIWKGDVVVAFSDGRSFKQESLWHEYFCINDEVPVIGKFNADRNDDMATFFLSTVNGSAQGDVYVSLTAAMANPEPGFRSNQFGYGTMGDQRPGKEERPLLVVLMKAHPTHAVGPYQRTASDYENLIFGSNFPNIREYFSQNSRGIFTFKKAGVVGPFEYPNGFEHPELKKKLPIIMQLVADSGFNLKQYDTNNDNTLQNDELSILIFENNSDIDGATRDTCQNIILNDGSTLGFCLGASGVGHLGGYDIVAHELSHLIGATDIYGYDFRCNSSRNTLMSCSYSQNQEVYHLDPYHKFRLGWIPSRIYDISLMSGTTLLQAPQSFPSNSVMPYFDEGPIIFFDGRRGTEEYYMLEFRNRDSPTGSSPNYDKNSGSKGMIMWYVRQDLDNYPHYPKWATLVWPGDDGILQTVPVVDDVYGTYLGKQCIYAGNDKNLQSARNIEGDDWVIHETEVFSMTSPKHIAKRNLTEAFEYIDGELLVNGIRVNSGRIKPSWIDGTRIGISIHVSDNQNNNEKIVIDWGKGFAPFIEEIPSSSQMIVGQTNRIRLEGRDIVRDHVTLYADNGSQKYALITNNGSQNHIEVEVPTQVPSGDYKLYFASKHNPNIIGNALDISILNTTSNLIDNPSVSNELELNVFPNPLEKGQMLTVSYKLIQPGPTELYISDILGRRLTTLSPIQTQMPGSHQSQYILNLPSGIYMLNIRYKGFTSMKKVIIK